MEAFSQRGYDVSFITDSYAWIAPETTMFTVHVLPKLTWTNSPLLLAPNILTIMNLLKKIQPDLVHLYVQHYYSIPLILSGLPYILTSWGNEVLKLPSDNAILKTLARYAAMNARKVTVDAECVKKTWIEIGIPEKKIEVIFFGVDVNAFNPNINGQDVRKRLGLGKDDIVVISTRAFYEDPPYNVECLIRAIPLVLKKHRNVRFIIKGEGPLENYLKNLVRELNVSRHVRFAGLVPHYEVAQYLAAADIYVSTCLIDTTSVSLLEAMACGLSPIVTDIVGNREWIKNGVNGFLFPPKNSNALAEKIIELVENKPLRKCFGQRCFQIVQKKATWKESLAKMEAVYKSLLLKKRT
jgi:glycosyltransferase involved in cell wall biosynthesis